MGLSHLKIFELQNVIEIKKNNNNFLFLNFFSQHLFSLQEIYYKNKNN